MRTAPTLPCCAGSPAQVSWASATCFLRAEQAHAQVYPSRGRGGASSRTASAHARDAIWLRRAGGGGLRTLPPPVQSFGARCCRMVRMTRGDAIGPRHTGGRGARAARQPPGSRGERAGKGGGLRGIPAGRKGGGRNMADQIPLYPVRGAAAGRKRAAYYSAAGPGPGAEWPSR